MKLRQVFALVFAAVLIPSTVLAGGFTITSIHGTVSVRHGASEQWTRCANGDAVNDADAIECAAGASALLHNESGSTIRLPQGAIIELSDLRTMTPEELSLRMAMDQVRSVPARDSKDSFGFPRTTSVHGASAEKHPPVTTANPVLGAMEINGAKVLFDHGYFGTCVLRSRNVFNRYPAISENADFRLVVARSFELLGMNGEALNEYNGILPLHCSAALRTQVQAGISRCKPR
jgi:hypothetical protein